MGSPTRPTRSECRWRAGEPGRFGAQRAGARRRYAGQFVLPVRGGAWRRNVFVVHGGSEAYSVSAGGCAEIFEGLRIVKKGLCGAKSFFVLYLTFRMYLSESRLFVVDDVIQYGLILQWNLKIRNHFNEHCV